MFLIFDPTSNLTIEVQKTEDKMQYNITSSLPRHFWCNVCPAWCLSAVLCHITARTSNCTDVSLLYWLRPTSTAAATEEMETMNQFLQQTYFASLTTESLWEVGWAQTKTKNANYHSRKQPGFVFRAWHRHRVPGCICFRTEFSLVLNINIRGRCWWRHPRLYCVLWCCPPPPYSI